MKTENLFSYGTLQLASVQVSLFNRLLTGHADVIQGYTLSHIPITDPETIAATGHIHYPILRHNGHSTDEIPGIVFELTTAELCSADEYEGDEYTRIIVTLKSGRTAWVYVG